jgi:hypothetical protein
MVNYFLTGGSLIGPTKQHFPADSAPKYASGTNRLTELPRI